MAPSSFGIVNHQNWNHLMFEMFQRIVCRSHNGFRFRLSFRRSVSIQANSQHFDLLCHDFPVDQQQFQTTEKQMKILENIRSRKMDREFPQFFEPNLTSEELARRLVESAKQLPNNCHPEWSKYPHEPRIVEIIGTKKSYDFEPRKAETILHELGLAYFSSPNTGNLGLVGGRRSYAFYDRIARLQRALSRWTMDILVNQYNFIPVVIPNLIYADVVRACGFEPFGERTQVYSLEKRPNICLAGTAEMPLAALNIGENFAKSEKDLPKRYCALSRCYRAEAKSAGEMSGLYRVHYFDKVEMFGLTDGEPGNSERLLEEFVQIEKHLFSQLGLHFRVVEMPPNELGRPAYRKFDIEAYMPGRNFWGEISSASNCTDYQSKRLNITYDKFYIDPKCDNEIIEVERKYVHTVNGTACAVPRIIIALVEQNQNNGQQTIIVPEVLRRYMDG